MFKQIDYTMVVVSDMQRSVEFYRDKLGIPLKFQSPDWTEFQTGTTTLALHGGGIAPSGLRCRARSRRAVRHRRPPPYVCDRSVPSGPYVCDRSAQVQAPRAQSRILSMR